MEALRVLWWSAGGFPQGQDPDAGAPGPDGVRIVGVRGQPDRDAARLAIRVALATDLQAWSGLDPSAIRLCGDAGEAPYALLDHGSHVRRVALAISHDGDISVGALVPHGAVGIDVMRLADTPDWEAVARDYLGPRVAAALAAESAEARVVAFARAWSAREARLKCRGLALSEWDAHGDAALAACPCWPLALPDGYVGSLAIAPAAPAPAR